MSKLQEAPVDERFLLYEMDLSSQVQILDEIVCIFHCSNTLGKGIYLTILSPIMGK